MPKTKTYRAWLVGVVLAGVLMLQQSPTKSLAQDQDQDDQDPPSVAARVNYTQGSVSFQPGDEGDWLTVVPNRPLTSGDNLWTDQDSRAELHVGSTAVRLAAQTSITLHPLRQSAGEQRRDFCVARHVHQRASRSPEPGTLRRAPDRRRSH